jgi:hypothetical protein
MNKMRYRETHVALIDLEKAYDNIHIEILWKKVENINVNPILIEVTINLYEKNNRRIKTGSKLTEEFRTTKGLRVVACPLHFSKFRQEPYKGGKGKVETYDCRWKTYCIPYTSRMTK